MRTKGAVAIVGVLSAIVASLWLTACSIEGTRQRNESCLQNRECASGLVCSPDTSSGDNRLRCTDPAGGTVPIVDGGRPDSGVAPADTGADTGASE
ncbi:MAG: hypothetical protein JNK05_08725 [Myxococcales bacterium]|nr:hypothetical protein [Myxococcales bacterium]